MKGSEAEERFKEAIQAYESAEDEREKAVAIVDAEAAAKEIEDEERKAEALAQVEKLRCSL